MFSFNKLLIPGAVAGSLLLAACGGSSHKTSSSSPAASASSPASQATSSPGGGLTIASASGPIGTYLTGASGRALYLWVADTAGKSSCSGLCAKAWPPVTASTTPKVRSGAEAANLSLVSRSDGTKQVAYKGHPLYYFIADKRAGMIRGQGNNGFGAKWWLVAPSGHAITASSSSGSASTNGSSSSSYGSSPVY